MLNSEKASLKKGRWLVLEQTSRTKEEVLALIRAMEGADVQIIDTKTYVRFPERQAETTKPLFKVRILGQKRTKPVTKDKETEVPRQYCAVILKNGR